jgi:hypothetical protein
LGAAPPNADVAGEPQIPALDFSFAILAKFGPLAAAFFWMPAVALALDHKEPNASPPAALLAAGLALPPRVVDDDVVVVDEKEAV